MQRSVRANDPELLKFLGLAPTQSASPQVEMAPPEPALARQSVKRVPEISSEAPSLLKMAAPSRARAVRLLRSSALSRLFAQGKTCVDYE